MDEVMETPDENVNVSDNTETKITEDVNESQDQSQETEKVEEETTTHKDSDDLPKGIKKRFSTLTRRNKEYEQTISTMQQEQEQLKRMLNDLATQREQQITRSDFNSDEEYYKHLAQKETENFINKKYVEPQKIQENALKHQQKLLEEWNERIEDQFEDTEDYRKVVSSIAMEPNNEVLNAIMGSEVGPKISYYLGKNKDVAEKLFSKSGTSLQREILKLEIKLEDTDLSTKSADQSISKAPKPLSKVSEKPILSKTGSTSDWIREFEKNYYKR